MLQTKTYNLETITAGVGGTVTFTETTSTSTTVTVNLTGAPAGGVHPAHIHDGVVGSGGPIAFPLTDVINSTSTTVINESFETLMNYDGYVNIHLSAAELNVIVAATNIGANE